jgi:RND family efflux transporter MFP subunit
MVDIADPAIPGGLDAADFVFKVKDDGGAGSWSDAPAVLHFDVRGVGGAGGIHRVTIIWQDHAIQDTWLQVTVLADQDTGLARPDVFYFGNLRGDTNGDGIVDGLDYNVWQNGYAQTPATPATGDFNADGAVAGLDYTAWQNGYGRSQGAVADRALFKIAMARKEGPTPADAIGIFAAVTQLPRSDLKAEAQYNMAELNARKQKEVYDQQGISELQYKNLLYGRDAAKANAELMKARYERTRLRSPIDGVLEDTFVDEGEFCAPGMPIARVVNTSRVKVQAEVPEHFANSFRVGAGARMTFDAAPGDTIRATISFTGSTVSPINRSLTVEILVPNEHGKLKPEMIAKVLLERESKANAIMISENVIQLVDRDRQIVFVEKGGKAEERRLTLGGREGNLVEVLDGLQPGDRLITVGYQKLVNGQPVVINQ